MKATGKLVLVILLASLLFSCNNSSKKEGEADNKTANPPDSGKTTAKNTIDTAAAKSMQLKAMFVDFTLGDASHFTFKDAAGKTWDFAGNEDSTAKFSVELPKNKANESNQGWGAAKDLQGKWFDITYINRNQPQYEGGPMANVPIIVRAVKAN